MSSCIPSVSSENHESNIGCRDQNGKYRQVVDCVDAPPYQVPDSEVFFHPVTGGPIDNAAAEQVNDDGKVKPAFAGPDITDVARPFAIGGIGHEVAVQNIVGKTKRMPTIGRDFVPTRT